MRDGDRRRAQITQAAFEIIAEKGFEGFRVRDVAARVGVNIATLHYYFATKEDLVRAVVEHILSFFTARGTPRSSGEMTAAEELRGEILDVEVQIREHPEMFVVMTEITARAHRDGAIREILARMDYGWRSRLAAIVMRGQRDRTIRANLDPQRAASFLTSLIKGMCNQAICGLDKPDFAGAADEIGRWAGVNPT